jgi:long-chain acyl-CoA synthetase
VLFWGENSPEWIAAFYGCMLRGAVAVPLDLKSASDFAARVQDQVSAKLLLTDLDQANLNLPILRLNTLTETIAHHSNEPYTATQITTDDLIEIVFTSGTTATPKGVCLTHRNLLANLTPIETEFRKYARWERLVHPLRILCLLPLSHVFGQMMGVFIPQMFGAEVYLRESYKPAEVIEIAREQRINVIVTVPRVIETLRDKIVRDYSGKDHGETFSKQLHTAESRHFIRNWWTFRDIHRRFGWRLWAFVTGGATLEVEAESFWRTLGFAVIQGYGMTETASVASISHPFRLVRGSIGKPIAGQEVKVSEQGEILVRGENVSPGYWGDGIKPLTDEQGWIRTGDLGEVDAQGDIYFRGRSKDTIVTGAGMKIYPEDLEAALDHQAEIYESVVIPFDGPKGIEALAVLIPSSADADVQAGVARANESLAEFQRIRHWITWPESDFPRTTSTRKVIKRMVAQTANQIVSRTLPTRDSTGSVILPVVSKVSGTNVTGIDPSATLADDLKLDSLGRVELLSALEDRYQVELDEAAITATTTVGEIDQMLREKKVVSTTYPYPKWALRFPIPLIGTIIYHVFLFPLTLLMCKVRVSGSEYLRDLNGPVLFISNHITDVDAALIKSALPTRWRSRLAIAMSGEILREWRYPSESLGWFYQLRMRAQYVLGAALFNIFSLPKQSGFRNSFAFAGEAMDLGWNVLVFPEGEETKDGRMQPFMQGIGLLTADLSVPVVPVKLGGELYNVKERKQFFVGPGRVTLTIGKPIEFKSDESPAEITRVLQLRVEEL